MSLIAGGDASETHSGPTDSWGNRDTSGFGTMERRLRACGGDKACMEAVYNRQSQQ